MTFMKEQFSDHSAVIINERAGNGLGRKKYERIKADFAPVTAFLYFCNSCRSKKKGFNPNQKIK